MSRARAVARFIRRQWFTLGLLVAVLAAWLVPEPGVPGGLLHPEITTHVGVALVFFSQGLTLPLQSLVRGAANYKLHVLIQGFTFLVLPGLGLLLDQVVGAYLPDDLRLGFLYLAVLPSTIKTAVVFSNLAGGDTASALFNATLSSLLGVLLTPLWIGVLSTDAVASSELWPMFEQIGGLLILPFALGVLTRPLVREWVDPRKNALSHLASSVILFLVYASFCRSFVDGTWERQGTATTVLAFALALGFFVVATGLVALTARALRLSREDGITALFSAPQKSLASGAPLAEVIFAGRADAGIVLLPLLFYHPLQLLLGGVLVSLLNPAEDPAAKRDAPRVERARASAEGPHAEESE